MGIWCMGTIVNTINTDHTNRVANKIILVPYQSIFNMVFIHIFFLSLFRGEKGGKGGGEVMCRDRITEFPLLKPVPQERGVAKCYPQIMTKGFY